MAYSNYFAVFDLETGGLSTKGDCSPITEIAICVIDNDLNDVKEFTSFIKPYEDASKYTAEALRVSNITLDLLESKGEDAAVVAKQVADFLKTARTDSKGKKPILVGHNIDSFDIPILNYFLAKHRQDLSKVADPNFTIDTKWWGRMMYPDLAGFTLGDCLVRENIDNDFAHRAITDTRANKEMFVRWMKRLRGEGAATSEAAPDRKNFRKSFRFQIRKKGE